MVPERRVQIPFEERQRPRKAGIWLELALGGPRLGRAHIVEQAWAVVGLCWVVSRVRCLATLMDRLGRRGGLFLEWASAAFEDGERHWRGELPEDNSSSAGRVDIVWYSGLFAFSGTGRRKGARRLSRLLGPVGFQLGS